MKKFISLIFVVFSLGYFANAQVNPHAIGLRLGGDGSVNGAEISYQHGLNSVNRIEMDFGFGASPNHTRTYMATVFHWDFNIVSGFNWFIGPGGAVGFYAYDNADNYVNVAVGGQFGFEYDFNALDVPLLVSVDGRPMWDFVGDNPGLGWGASLGIRYTW